MADLNQHNIRGVVLAGVHRWDEAGFEGMSPLPLMPVARTPLICHVLEWLRHTGVSRATVCANSASRQVRKQLRGGDALKMELDYYEDWTPRGPAGCIRDSALEPDADMYVVVDGTIMPRCHLRTLLEQHVESQAAMTIVAARDVHSAAASEDRYTPAGIYVLNRSVLEHIPETGYQDVKEVLLPHLHRHDIRTAAYVLATPCTRLTNPASYLAINALALEWLARGERETSGYRRLGGCLVHESAQVDESEALIGPALLGPETRIESGATIVGPTSIGAGCRVEAHSAICRSILWDGCRIGARASVNQCVLSDGTRVEADASMYQVASATSGGCEHILDTARPETRWLSLTPYTDVDTEYPLRDHEQAEQDKQFVALWGVGVN